MWKIPAKIRFMWPSERRAEEETAWKWALWAFAVCPLSLPVIVFHRVGLLLWAVWEPITMIMNEMGIRFIYFFTFHPPTRLLVSTAIGQCWDKVFVPSCLIFMAALSSPSPHSRSNPIFGHRFLFFLSSADPLVSVVATDIVGQEVRLSLSLKSLLRLLPVKERAGHVTQGAL